MVEEKLKNKQSKEFDEEIILMFKSEKGKEPKKVKKIIYANKKGNCFDCQRYLTNPKPKEIFFTIITLGLGRIDICLDCSWKRNHRLFQEYNRLTNWEIVFKIFKKLREREFSQYVQ